MSIAAFCSACGHRAESEARFCSACGRPLDELPDEVLELAPDDVIGVLPAEPAAAPADAAPADAAPADAAPAMPGGPAQAAPGPKMLMPYFPVAIHKLIVMSVCTLGVYQLYWAYQHWKRIKLTTGEKLSPFWRALFGGLWSFSMFRRIKRSSEENAFTPWWQPDLLAILYLAVAGPLWRLPGPWWLAGYLAFLPLVPPQLAANRVNRGYAAPDVEGENGRYSGWNVVMIVVGVPLFALVVWGAFLEH